MSFAGIGPQGLNVGLTSAVSLPVVLLVIVIPLALLEVRALDSDRPNKSPQ